MTSGNPTKLLIGFSLPMLLGNLFQQLYNMVDSIVVGQFVGADALAAVGSAFSLVNMVTWIVNGLSIGVSVLLGQYFGARNDEKVKKTISTGVIFVCACSLAASVICLFCARPLLLLIRTPDNIIEDSVIYLQIIFGGLIFSTLYSVYAYLLKALGDSKTPLYFIILASIINIALDLLFVIEFHMGVAGVAWATIIAQFVSSICCIFYSYLRIPLMKIGLRAYRFDRQTFREMSSLSLSSAFQLSISQIGIVMVQGLVNTFGSPVIAAFSAASKIDAFANLPMTNVGNAVSAYVAQNVGAKQLDRVRGGFKSGIIITSFTCIAVSALVLPFSYQLIGIFVSEPNVIEIGTSYLSIIAATYILLGFLHIYQNFFRGVGQVKTTMCVSFISLGLRVSCAYLLSPSMGYWGIWISLPIGWVVANIFGFLVYRKGNWMNILGRI